jgi:hypothetical protein
MTATQTNTSTDILTASAGLIAWVASQAAQNEMPPRELYDRIADVIKTASPNTPKDVTDQLFAALEDAEKAAHMYTVTIAYPSWMCEGDTPDTYSASYEAGTPKQAVFLCRSECIADNGYDEDGDDAIDATDFEVIDVVQGGICIGFSE